MPTDTLRHVVLFLHGSFALERRSLIVMRIAFLRLRRDREILFLICDIPPLSRDGQS
jgi:hypothetical protein